MIEYIFNRINNAICTECSEKLEEYLVVDDKPLCMICAGEVWAEERETRKMKQNLIAEIEPLARLLYTEMTGHDAHKDRSVVEVLNTTLKWLRLRQGTSDANRN